MEYSKEALEAAEKYIKEFRNRLLEFAMNEAAHHSDAEKIEPIHVEWAYKRIMD